MMPLDISALVWKATKVGSVHHHNPVLFRISVIEPSCAHFCVLFFFKQTFCRLIGVKNESKGYIQLGSGLRH